MEPERKKRKWKRMINYTILLSPVTKKNHQQIFWNHATGKPFISQSKQYKEYEQKALWYIRPVPKTPINEPCNVKIMFYMPTKRRVDLVNLQEATLDILVKAGALADDNYNVVYSMDGSRVFYDKTHPRTEVEICPLDEIQKTV